MSKGRRANRLYGGYCPPQTGRIVWKQEKTLTHITSRDLKQLARYGTQLLNLESRGFLLSRSGLDRDTSGLGRLNHSLHFMRPFFGQEVTILVYCPYIYILLQS